MNVSVMGWGIMGRWVMMVVLSGEVIIISAWGRPGRCAMQPEF